MLYLPTLKKKKYRFSKNATPCLISKIGTWLDNLQDGVGIAIYSNGDRFEGVWREGQGAGGVQDYQDGGTHPHR